VLYLVLFEGVEKMVEVLVPDRASLDGSGEFGEHRVVRVSGIVGGSSGIEMPVQSFAERPESLQSERASRWRRIDIVGKVVGATAEGVHRGKIAHELLGEKRREDREVLVGSAGLTPELLVRVSRKFLIVPGQFNLVASRILGRSRSGVFRTMRIVLANPRGFCAGVHMAIQVVEQLLDVVDEPVYVYHDIVHNTHVVRRFEDRGVVFVEDVNDVPEGSYVVFSAHGVSPEVRAKAASRGLHAIDATCPLVTKVHMEAIRYAKRGYQILLVGHEDHQEIIGTRGEAPEQTQVVESPADIPNLSVHDPKKLVYLTQTTLSTDDAGIIIDALKEAFPDIQAPPTEDICYATTNRQHAVREIAPDCDLTIVVGSTTSSNSKRLTEISANVGTPGVLVDDVTDLNPSLLENVDRVLVTAGASVPEDLVQQLCRVLVREYDAEIEVASLVDESTEFQLPKSLRDVMKSRDVDPQHRRLQIGQWKVTKDLYGAVPVTVSAPSGPAS